MSKTDLENLLKVVVASAQYLLKKNKEMYPIGAVVNLDGEVLLAQPNLSLVHPQAQQVIDDLLIAFRKKAEKHEIKATAICYDGRVSPPGKTEKTDAICVELEDIEGNAIAIFFPYKKGWLRKQMYLEPFACAGEVKIFHEY